MSHNIRCFAFSLVSLFTLQNVHGQMVDELKDLDTSSIEEPFSQFQISADITSITAGLLGGGGDGDFHFGIQAKYLRNKMGFRFQFEFYPQTTTN